MFAYEIELVLARNWGLGHALLAHRLVLDIHLLIHYHFKSLRISYALSEASEVPMSFIMMFRYPILNTLEVLAIDAL